MARSFKSVVSIDDQASASSEALRLKVTGEANARLSIDAGGKLTWGSGSASGDATLYRSAANALKTDDTFQAALGVITLTTDGAPSSSLADGAVAVDTTNDSLYFRSSSNWQAISNLIISDGVPSGPVAGDLWFESDTGRTFVYYADGSSNQWVEVGSASSSGVHGAAGKVQFSEGNTFASDTLLHWDNSNNRLGVGTASPAHTFHVEGTPLARDSGWSSSGDLAIWALGSSVGAAERFGVGFKHSTGMIMSVYKSGGGGSFGANSYDAMTILDTSGKVGIGTSAPETPLHIVAANTLGSTFTGTVDGEGLRVAQSNYSADNYVSLVEAPYDDGQTAAHVRIGAMFDGGGSHLAFGTSNNYANGITNTAMFIDQVGNVGIGTTSPVLTGLTIGRVPSDANEGGQLNLEGGTSHSNNLSLDRYGNDLRFIYNSAVVGQWGSTGSINIYDAGQLILGTGSDLKIYANGSNSFIDHNGDGDLWMRVLGAGENMYFNTSTSAKILIQRNSVSQMEFRDGSTTHTGGGNDADAEYGGVGFAAAGIFIDHHWLGNPGITICNTNASGGTAQGTFRFHGSDHTWASYPAQGGSDFGIAVVCDGTFSPTSDERRKTDIEDITGALASVNALRGRTFKFKNSNLETEEPGSIGGKLYGMIAQEALDVVPHAIWDDEEEPLENGWCRSMRMDYGALTAVLVEAIKELTTRLEALEAA